MADNVTSNPGAGGYIFGSDDIGGGVQIPRAKMTWGPDGTANDADIASGKSLPIQIRSATGLIPIGEPTDAKNSATDGTSVGMIALLKQLSASLQTIAAASIVTTTVNYKASISNVTNVSSSASNVTLLSANANRLAFTMYNDSTSPVDVKTGATASSSSLTARLLPGGFLSSKDLGVNYTGQIDAIWDSANGAMRITEYTA